MLALGQDLAAGVVRGHAASLPRQPSVGCGRQGFGQPKQRSMFWRVLSAAIAPRYGNCLRAASQAPMSSSRRLVKVASLAARSNVERTTRAAGKQRCTEDALAFAEALPENIYVLQKRFLKFAVAAGTMTATKPLARTSPDDRAAAHEAPRVARTREQQTARHAASQQHPRASAVKTSHQAVSVTTKQR
jgi:hypothetical protein